MQSLPGQHLRQRPWQHRVHALPSTALYPRTDRADRVPCHTHTLAHAVANAIAHAVSNAIADAKPHRATHARADGESDTKSHSATHACAWLM